MNKSLSAVAVTLLVIGGLNWGLVGLFEFNLVAEIFGEESGLSRIIYSLVGLSALYVAAEAAMRSSKSTTPVEARR